MWRKASPHGPAGDIEDNPGTQGNQIMCSSAGSPVRTAASGGLVAPNGTVALPGCDFKFAVWGVGTRTIWHPVTNLELGVADQRLGCASLTRRNVGGSHTPGNHTTETELHGWGGRIRTATCRNQSPLL